MSKTTSVTARIEPELKENVEVIFDRLGLTTAQAITLFFRQVEMYKGLPFAVRVFSAETIAALEESENYQALPAYANVDDLFAALES
ncbi:Addiction module antitoxin, RelB/DinJ family [Candidatus Promineifilum breve]|uniref:Addiction module antitoxin, RelB/DinJ family n=1 Tax=Candidatus Promineifilum breve TaxID=1806508 RepID=A0A160T6U8_9CHLR|nr:type II toxin-antitoxin system RelB/DinJ family antitoxin [Candidatus Promineifilum breve]CUS05764.1 Addiction module antitoxin, RelB/DinJ family [Candidatus Promineifilum breve]